MRAEPTSLRFRYMHGGGRLTIRSCGVCNRTNVGGRRSLGTALLLLLLTHSSRLFLLPFGLTVITLVQRDLRWCAAHVGRCLEHSTPLFAVAARKLTTLRREVCYGPCDR